VVNGGLLRLRAGQRVKIQEDADDTVDVDNAGMAGGAGN